MEGKPLRLSGDANPGQNNVAGNGDSRGRGEMMPDAADFELKFYLTSREQMLSAERGPPRSLAADSGAALRRPGWAACRAAAPFAGSINSTK